jgi:ABC-type uncharacterized transport system permease subunit
MGHPDGAHTHGSGGSGLGELVLIVLGAAVVVAVAGPVLAAVAELLDLLLIVAGICLGLAAVGVVAYVAYRVRHRPAIPARAAYPLPRVVQRPVQARSEPRAAIERPQEVHLHLHGVSAEDIAALLSRRDDS